MIGVDGDLGVFENHPQPRFALRRIGQCLLEPRMESTCCDPPCLPPGPSSIASDMIAAGREDELEQLRRYISTIAPELPDEPAK